MILLGIIFSALSFASGPTCHTLWDNQQTGFAFDLQKVVSAEKGETIDLNNLFTNDHRHNAALVNLLMLKPGIHFRIEIDAQVYLDQVRLFDILRQNKDVTLMINNKPIVSTVHQPTMREIQWMRRTARQYLRERNVADNIDLVTSYYNLLDFYLSANP